MHDSITLRIHYDTGWENSIFVRGSDQPLSWYRGHEATWHEGNVWVYTFTPTTDEVYVKALINDRSWQIGADIAVRKGEIKDIYPHFHSRSGRHVVHHHFDTPIVIHLPPSYDENPFKDYPVIYMHDGQNLFDPATAFMGQVWGVDKTLDRLVNDSLMEEVIAVGIYNRGAARIHDFTPSYDPDWGQGVGGGADDYLELIIEDIMPYVDSHFRTRSGREHTALMGSSLGGLVSLYMARERPDIFGKIAALSSSFWWNRRNLIRRILRTRRYVPLRIYLDAGSRDNDRETLEMYRVLIDVGYKPGENLFCHIAPRAAHSEVYWGQRVHIPLQFLFPVNGRHHPDHWREEPLVVAAGINDNSGVSA